ncbi:MAG TPA: polysaccharide biosynthesis/export family protein [Gammaproteobacteria bacterium]|nr:polysaccharide biosynthesis/export family protein [Gammaproteobacteria bacterium]
MLRVDLNKIVASIFFLIMLSSCAPLIPSNYLRPSAIQASQKINKQWLKPRLIPVSAEMLNTPKGRALLEPAMRPQPYRIGAYDNLNVIVWGHPEFSTIATSPISAMMANAPASAGAGGTNPVIIVQTDGTIFFPYVGNTKIAGLTIEQAQRKIAQRLSTYLRNPQVTVQVARFRNRNIYVLGEVGSAGMQALTDKPLSLMEALSSAGGINPGSADPSHIYLIRGSYRQPDVYWFNIQTPQSLLIAERFPLQENDIVYVPSSILSPWNAFVNQILPQFSTYYTIKALAQQ